MSASLLQAFQGSLLPARCRPGPPAQAANLLVAEDGRVQLADFGACALLERAEASAVVSESRSRASLDGGASAHDGAAALSTPPQVPSTGCLAGRSWEACSVGACLAAAAYRRNIACL